MFKKIALIGLMFGSTTTFADSPYWMSLDLGVASQLKQSDYDQQLADRGVNANLSISDTPRFTGRIGLGYDFKPDFLDETSPWSFSAQLEYLSLGSVDVNFSGSAPSNNTDFDVLTTIHPETIEHGLATSLLTHWKGFSGALQPFSITGRLGMTAWQHNYELFDANDQSVGTDKRSGFSPTVGVDLAYSVNRFIDARLGWNYYSMDQESAQALTIGLTLRPSFNQERQEKVETLERKQTDFTSVADNVSVKQGGTVIIDVFANDYWSEDITVVLSALNQPQHGNAEIIKEGQMISYQAPNESISQDIFDYWVSDGRRQYGPFTAQVIIEKSHEKPFVFFAKNKSEIQIDSIKNLSTIYQEILENPEADILLIGHTDDTGTEEYNLQLSLKRAQSLKNYLVRTLGINAENIQISGEGEYSPIDTNSTEEGRANNRRTEVLISH